MEREKTYLLSCAVSDEQYAQTSDHGWWMYRKALCVRPATVHILCGMVSRCCLAILADAEGSESDSE